MNTTTAVLLPTPPGRTERIGVAYHGKLTADDSRALFELIEEHARRHEKVRLLVDMRDYGGTEAKVAWEKLHHVKASMQTVERMAVVGEPSWLRIWMGIASHFVPIEVRHFDANRLDDAWRWLDEDDSSG
ncbi:MAG: STAS/SEC14 domain-containing protein [Polyangiaceae bacterium]